jgi:hypothetical protein
MKLNMFPITIRCLNELLLVPDIDCNRPLFCSDVELTKIFDRYNLENKNKYIQTQIAFLLGVSTIQYDYGRICMGGERIKNLKRLTDNSWRSHYQVVTNGLRTGVITLEYIDIQKLSITLI